MKFLLFIYLYISFIVLVLSSNIIDYIGYNFTSIDDNNLIISIYDDITNNNNFVGADVGASIFLNNSINQGQQYYLWFFGDTLIGSIKNNARIWRNSTNPSTRNSIGVWCIENNSPVSNITHIFNYTMNPSLLNYSGYFNTLELNQLYWPIGGININSNIYVINERMYPNVTIVGIDVFQLNTTIIDDPSQWTINNITTLPGMSDNTTIGNCFIQVLGYIYLFGSMNHTNYDGIVTRIQEKYFISGNWSQLQVFTGNLEWNDYYSNEIYPYNIFSPLPLTSCITYSNKYNIWIILIADVFYDSGIYLRWSYNLYDWSESIKIYDIPSSITSNPNNIYYAPNFHDEFNTNNDEIVWSYNTNSFYPEDLIDDLNLYFPRFVRTSIIGLTSVPTSVPTSKPSKSIEVAELIAEEKKLSNAVVIVIVVCASIWLILGLRYYIKYRRKSKLHEVDSNNAIQLLNSNNMRSQLTSNEVTNPVLVRID